MAVPVVCYLLMIRSTSDIKGLLGNLWNSSSVAPCTGELCSIPLVVFAGLSDVHRFGVFSNVVISVRQLFQRAAVVNDVRLYFLHSVFRHLLFPFYGITNCIPVEEISLPGFPFRIPGHDEVKRLRGEVVRLLQRQCCKFVVEAKICVDDRQFSSTPRTDRE
jgi:hypothetical protein